MSRLHVVAVVVGVVAAVLAQWGLALAQLCCMSQETPPMWVGPALLTLVYLAILVPGFVAGCISKTKGALTGLMASVLGAVVNSIPLNMGLLHGVGVGALTSGRHWLPILGSAVIVAIPGAVAGAAGELLRSNYAFEQTVKQPRNIRRDRAAAQRER